MNKLNIRLSLAFIAVVILVLVIPILISGILNELGLSRVDEVPAFVESIPPAELEQLMDFMTQFFIRQVILYAILAAIIGSIAGILVSRNLTAPLGKLAKAARAIGQGELSSRVTVEGSEEIVDVSQAFNDMAQDLEQAETLRRNLLADVAHELRTPVTVVQGNLRAILDDVYPLEKEEISRLYDQTRHLTNLINDLQELALAEARRLPLNQTDVNVAELVKTTAVSFQPIAVEAKILLRIELLGAHPHAFVDRDRLRQCILNLLDNALRHTPKNGTIHIQVERKKQTIEIRVQDNGEGIDPAHIEHIFDRFYRADPARSRVKGGSGLGLAIVRAFIKAQDGEVTVVSAGLGQGSLFTIHLPLLT
ncbi:MAG: HAMP domain-containing protein [Anaerolineales bacterium]|nr:HAMP domain-containing protein [Anaerolineales bacterium]